MRLDPRMRWLVYGLFGALFATGAVWFAADQLKDGADDERWKSIAAWMLMLHGGAAMMALLALGALIPIHMLRGWRARVNRVTGVLAATTNAALIATAFALYYLGSETLRPLISALHLGLGAGFPLLLAIHIRRGRSHRARREAGGRGGQGVT